MRRELQEHLEWLESAADVGALDSLDCPNCHSQSVSVRFTHPAEHEYRTWFICSQCGFQLRTIDDGRPPHFSDSRVDQRLQAYDANLLATARFRPEDGSDKKD